MSVTIATDAGAGTTVKLDVQRPDGTILPTITGTTDAAGKVTLSFTTATKQGQHNLTITAGGSAYSASLWSRADTPISLLLDSPSDVLYVGGMYVLPDNNFAKVPLYAVAVDQYGNYNNTTAITITTNKGPYSAPMNANGIAGPVYSGPYVTPTVDNLVARTSTLTSNSGTINYVDCTITQSVSSVGVTVGTDVTVTTNVKINGNNYNNVPVTYYVTRPGEATQKYTINTTSGKVVYNITIGQQYGMNYIMGSVDLLGIHYTSTVWGINGAPANITLTKTPIGSNHDASGNVYADGSSKYLLEATVKDANGNPVPNINVEFVDAVNDTWDVITDGSGVSDAVSIASNYVQQLNVRATEGINNNVASTTLNFVAGPATRISVRASPYVIASSDVPQGADVNNIHETNITAFVTDDWFNPISGKTVTFSVLSGNGSIEAPVSNVTVNGAFTTKFLLDCTTPNSAAGKGNIIVNAVLNDGSNKNANGTIIYTNRSYLDVESSITPLNATVNKTINVSVNITGIGWKSMPMPRDVELAIDSSSSMSWATDIISDPSILNTLLSTGNTDYSTIPTMTDPVPNDQTTIGNSKWHAVGSFIQKKSKMGTYDIMLTWNFNNTGAADNTRDSKYTYYLMRVKDSSGNVKSYGSLGLTENSITGISGWADGTYTIELAYHKGTLTGDSPFYLNLENGTSRINSAVSAADAFVDAINVTPSDSVGVVGYNANIKVNSPFVQVNALGSANRNTIKNTIGTLPNNMAGGTLTNLSLSTAISNLNARASSKKYIILLTDGYSYYPAEDRKQADIAAQKGIIINTIGIGGADATNLQYIATHTGGEFVRVNSTSQLIQTFKNMAYDMGDVVAINSSLNLIGDRMLVNGVWANTTEYVPHSAQVTFNHTTKQIEPVMSINGQDYTLTWIPGKINISETWGLKYQLMVNRSGYITPITDRSNIWFLNNDSQPETDYLNSVTVFATNTSTMSDPNNPLINVSNVKAVMQGEYMTIQWDVWYNGTSTYTSTLGYTYNGVTSGLIATVPGYDNTTLLHHFSQPWDVGPGGLNLPAGTIAGTITAADPEGNSDSKPFTGVITDTSGRIILS